MALTLVEAAKAASGDTLRSSIIELFARNSDILMALPFTDIPGNAYKYVQEQALAGVAFRGVNEAYTESVGVLNPQVEQLAIAGGDLDVDKFLVDTHGPAQRSIHTALKVKALAQAFSLKFIKGDSVAVSKEFDGLQKRLAIGGAQVLEAGSTNGGDALSLAKLDEAIDACDMPTHLFMSKAMRRRLTTAARATTVGGFITYDLDAFGRKMSMYNDLPILIADNNADQNAILGFNEVGVGGATATATSIYVLSLRPGMLSGIQNGGISVRDLGEQDAKPVYRTRVEWYTSCLLEHPRAAARLRGISNAAVVA